MKKINLVTAALFLCLPVSGEDFDPSVSWFRGHLSVAAN